MRRIIFDIETCAYPVESLSESQQEYLLRYSEKETEEERKSQKRDDAIRYLSLYPLTAKVIAIGIYHVEKEKTFVYFESNQPEEWMNEEKNISYKGLNEKEMIQSFWRIVDFTDQVVTFNGRNFDIPFIMMRSAMLEIRPTKNLMGNRFNSNNHLDLLEQFTFYATTRKFNLDFYCQAFGIESPKSKGISGMEVKNLYEAGRIKDIAMYCAEDVNATAKLYHIWNDYLNI